MLRLFIWGIGQKTSRCIKKGFFNDVDVVAYVQTHKSEDNYNNKPVVTPEDVANRSDEVDYIVINNDCFSEILGLCYYLKIPDEKLVITNDIKDSRYEKYYYRLRDVIPSIFEDQKGISWQVIRSNESDHVDEKKMVGFGRFKTKAYLDDYVRYRAFELNAKEIIREGVNGDVAELGVYNGEFSGLIRELFPDRRMFLFDTFEGFDKEEAKKEVEDGNCNESFVNSHGSPSIEELKKNIPDLKRCVICKGLFPKSITEEAANTKFAFVSLDVDFEESTFQGLSFFYSRLAVGGRIFLHDYNTWYLSGVKKAVERYEVECGETLKKVALPDRAGTLIIIK